ncbi:glycosyltransferase family 2 protein [Botryobacter ruber]|uniref:glycosyltransferase family 2 protein n=1 Tax=Botryobacter ruber TaxID=2171629 RepID=UPI000E0B42E8|nr:glycosyltransferase family 2 protein [Botryobacter ruber]
MMMHPPYQIMHVHLHEQQAQPPLDVACQGNYLVFWWEDVALGHLFISPGEKTTEAAYYKKLVAAIGPAVQFYAESRHAAAPDWELWLLMGEFEMWTSWMKTIFSACASEALPAKVPVSVLICTRNRTAALERCLASLQRMVCQPEEVIIIDNAPADNRTEQLVKSLPGIKYLKEPLPGLSYARNTGVRAAAFPVVAFTDDDVLVHPAWVYWVWQTFQQKNVAAMTGLVITSELETEAQQIFEKRWGFNRGYIDRLYDSDFLRENLRGGAPVWNIGAGANMAFRKAIFEIAGYFDERLGAGASGCSEDSEMWYRILVAGKAIVYNPRAIAYHAHRKSMTALHKQLFSYMKGHVAAALMQQAYHAEAGYRRHIFWRQPKNYVRLILKGFPFYRSEHSTLWSEISGMVAGVLFYLKNRDKKDAQLISPEQVKAELLVQP